MRNAHDEIGLPPLFNRKNDMFDGVAHSKISGLEHEVRKLKKQVKDQEKQVKDMETRFDGEIRALHDLIRHGNRSDN